MSKVIQIRGVPDDVHAKLVAAAEQAGKSLTAYLADELQSVAARADLVWHNREVVLAGQRAIGARPAPGAARRALHEGRTEREKDLARAAARRRDR